MKLSDEIRSNHDPECGAMPSLDNDRCTCWTGKIANRVVKLEAVVKVGTSVCGNAFEIGDDTDHYRIPKKYVNDLYGKLAALETDDESGEQHA